MVEGPLPCGGHGTWEAAPPFALGRFVAAICADTTRPHRLRIRSRSDDGRLRWITRGYFALEEEQVQAHARREEVVTAKTEARRRRQQAQLEAEQRHQAAIAALLRRQQALIKPVVEFVYHEAGHYPQVDDGGTPDFAMGIPVYVRDLPYAVICPVASRIPALRTQLAPLILIAATESERRRIAAEATRGQRIEVIEPDPAAMAEAAPPPAEHLTIKQAVKRMMGLDRM